MGAMKTSVEMFILLSSILCISFYTFCLTKFIEKQERKRFYFFYFFSLVSAFNIGMVFSELFKWLMSL